MKKKTFKRAGAAVLSMAMLLSFGAIGATSAYAAGENHSVTITNSNANISNDSINYVYVKIADATETATGSDVYTYSNLNPIFNGVLSIPAGATTINYNGTSLGTITSNSAEAQTVATALAALVTDSNKDGDVTIGTAVTGLNTGYYLFTDTANNASPILLFVKQNESVSVKATGVPFNKKITAISTSHGADANVISKADNDATDAVKKSVDGKTGIVDKGSTVTYEISTAFPTYSEAVKVGTTTGTQSYSSTVWGDTAGAETVTEAYYEYIASEDKIVYRAVGDAIERAAGEVIVKPALTIKSATTNISDFLITDIPEDSLSILTNTIAVTVGTTRLTKDVDYEIVPVAAKDATAYATYTGFDKTTKSRDYVSATSAGFTIRFKDETVINHKGEPVVVTFDANVSTDDDILDLKDDPNNNTATLHYNNNYFTGGSTGTTTVTEFDVPDGYNPEDNTPVTPEKPNTPEDQNAQDKSEADVFATVYTVNKTYDGDDGTRTENATFAIYDSTGNTKLVDLVANDDGTVYTYKGLGVGEYKLKEVSAPAGYKKDETVYDLVITTDKDGKTVANLYDGVFKFNNTATDTLSVTNYKGQTLPGTGGMGTILFTVGGAAIVLLAGTMFVIYMKKRKVEE